MNVNIYSKHQKSRKPKYVATDPITMKVMYSSNNKKEFEFMKRLHREELVKGADNE